MEGAVYLRLNHDARWLSKVTKRSAELLHSVCLDVMMVSIHSGNKQQNPSEHHTFVVLEWHGSSGAYAGECVVLAMWWTPFAININNIISIHPLQTTIHSNFHDVSLSSVFVIINITFLSNSNLASIAVDGYFRWWAVMFVITSWQHHQYFQATIYIDSRNVSCWSVSITFIATFKSNQKLSCQLTIGLLEVTTTWNSYF